MTVTSFFEKFAGLRKQRIETAVASYRDLIGGIATGEEPNPLEVERLLADSGKTLDDLRKDVEQYQHRMALKAAVAARPNVQADLSTIDERIAAADRVLAIDKERHAETTKPLHFRREELLSSLSEAEDAFAQLVYTCDDANLQREFKEFEDESRRLNQEYRELYKRANYLDRKAAIELDAAKHEIMPPAVRNPRFDLVERCKQEAESLRREAKKVEQACIEFEKHRTGIEQRMRQD